MCVFYVFGSRFQPNGPRGHSRSYSSTLTKFITIGRGKEFVRTCYAAKEGALGNQLS